MQESRSGSRRTTSARRDFCPYRGVGPSGRILWVGNEPSRLRVRHFICCLDSGAIREEVRNAA